MSDPSGAAPLDLALRSSLASVAGMGVLLAGGALPLFGVRSALSVGAGALLATLNLYALGRIASALLSGRRGLWGPLGVAKILFLFISSWFLITHEWVSALPFVVGLSALPAGLSLGALHGPKV